uniref:Uncharacterized protein n=1 Tax=Panagrolaimus sp. ES5 TaxID=591445 RepID=A0AC34FYE3_9BILA
MLRVIFPSLILFGLFFVSNIVDARVVEDETAEFDMSRKDKSHTNWANCTSRLVEDYCTADGLNHVYFKNDDYGYNSTETIETIEDDAYHICFVQETIKCFQRSHCDIQNHTQALMFAREDCKKKEDRFTMGLAIAAASKVQAEKMRDAWFIKYNETFKTIEELNRALSDAQNSNPANAQMNNIILF